MKDRTFSRSRGSMIAELGSSMFLMIVIGAIGANLGIVLFGCMLNDAACRDACRAAANQVNSSLALSAAQSQLRIHSTDGYYVSQPSLASVTGPDFVYNDYSGNPPANTSPYVTVTTSLSARLPAPIFFFGSHISKNGVVQFRRRYTFPIVKVRYYG